MKTYKYHYVYRITNLITEMHYYGSRSCNCQPSDDIGTKYFSTFSNKFFKIDQQLNPQDYKYKVVRIFETTREDATQVEVDLHAKFNVRKHHKFINRANQTSRGFICNRENYHHSDKTKRKISKSNMGKIMPMSGREKISKGNTGKKRTAEQKLAMSKARKNPSEEVRKNYSKAFKGRKLSEAWKEKIGKANKEVWTDEKRKLFGESKKGILCSDEHKQKISRALTGRKLSKEHCINMGNARKGVKHSIEHSKKIGESNKGKRSLSINVYDNNDNLVYETSGNFIEFCKLNNLPANALKSSYNNNSKVLYQSKQAQTIATKNNFIQFKGWYAKLGE